jgi:hypothetical protein
VLAASSGTQRRLSSVPALLAGAAACERERPSQWGRAGGRTARCGGVLLAPVPALWAPACLLARLPRSAVACSVRLSTTGPTGLGQG